MLNSRGEEHVPHEERMWIVPSDVVPALLP